MTLEQQQQQCPQIPHSDQQRQRGGRSRVDGADDFSDVRHNSTRFLLDPGYKARKFPERQIVCVEKGGSTETHLARAIQAFDSPFGCTGCIDFAQDNLEPVVGIPCLHNLHSAR